MTIEAKQHAAQLGATAGSQAKVERYKWVTQDSPGTFILLDKTMLKVDHDYQRGSSESKVLRIAREWSWIACGAISVAFRDGEWWVIDGQHRVLAALRRFDIETLPCMVFETSNKVEEAAGFLNANVNRKPMDAVGKFKAMIITKNSTALFANSLIQQTGRSVSRGTGASYFSCVAALIRCLDNKRKATVNIWPILVKLCENEPFHSHLLEAMVYIEHKMLERGESLTQHPWRKRILKFGYHNAMTAIQKAATYHTGTGARVWAIGLADALNKGNRTNKIPLGTVEDA